MTSYVKFKMSKHKPIIEGRVFWGGLDENMCRMWLGRGNEVARTSPLAEPSLDLSYTLLRATNIFTWITQDISCTKLHETIVNSFRPKHEYCLVPGSLYIKLSRRDGLVISRPQRQIIWSSPQIQSYIPLHSPQNGKQSASLHRSFPF